MRKAQKRQAEEFVESLSQANKKIRKTVERGDQTALVLDLLGQCQEGAITLGNMIEQLEGEDTVTVRLLEDYCEQLYQYHEKIRRGEPVKAGREFKNLQSSIDKIEDSIRKIKERLEVVFLPYKASMWDSLESVWKAADAEPDCDAYVVPIPYYDKNPDGSFREMHYEGNLYPKDVPVVWYGDYDLAERRPDMIFIHNPYDEYNFVTSVHPDFYSGKLKEYTGKLVYIPYFILGEINPKSAYAVEHMQHFCTTPGVMNADKVVVQSENMRQIYIDVLSRHAGEHTRKLWEKKIVGTGSPKVDKVLNTRREDIEIPEEWMRVIRKADGTWKKIVFFNTTVAALLKYNEKMLAKMEEVFELFKEKSDEIALLWRPHPLTEATISSMRPQLWAAYEQLLRVYRSEGWGIYDDTADLDRALALCDAYYGDGSSVAQLCLKAEKPVMFQKV